MCTAWTLPYVRLRHVPWWPLTCFCFSRKFDHNYFHLSAFTLNFKCEKCLVYTWCIYWTIRNFLFDPKIYDFFFFRWSEIPNCAYFHNMSHVLNKFFLSSIIFSDEGLGDSSSLVLISLSSTCLDYWLLPAVLNCFTFHLIINIVLYVCPCLLHHIERDQ